MARSMAMALFPRTPCLSTSASRICFFNFRQGGTNYLNARCNRLDSAYFLAGKPRCYSGSVEDSTISSSSSSSANAIPAKKRVVSGVQPTGSIHLGNYLGAIKNWVSLQDTYETLFFIVDLHAITLPYDAGQLSKLTRDAAAIYIACGIDTSKGDENVGTGLLTYPVLMASDILLYQCDLVPVGDDQKQHLELTRELAERVNFLFGGRKWKKLGGHGGKLFKIPDALISPEGARVMSLTDGLSKMSKSTPSDQSRINLLDTKDIIANKFKRCKTDSLTGLEFGNPERPECNNLLSIYQLVTGKTKQEVVQECKDMNWGQFKPLIADAVIAHLEPIQARYKEITADSTYLDSVLAEGALKAATIADTTLRNVYEAMGFLPCTRR